MTILLLSIWALALLITLFSAIVAVHHLEDDSMLPIHTDFPPISILKPIIGFESGLPHNIESFFNLDYPKYELLFSFQEDGRGVELVKRLSREHPSIPIKIFITQHVIGPNPKINNLYQSYNEASYEHILISDSNIRATPGYLRGLMKQMEPGVGCVTSVVVGRKPISLGGELEAMILNAFCVRGMLFVHTVASFPCVVGKSMLFMKSALEQIGGMYTLGQYLAEDFITGTLMKKAHYDVEIAHQPIEQHIGRYTIRDFWRRHVRWGRIRKAHEPFAFLVMEPLMSCAGSCLLAVLAFHSLWVVPFHVIFWLLCDLYVLHHVHESITPRTVAVWLLREMIVLPMWLTTAVGNSVNWRGKRYRVERGGKLVALSKPMI